MAAARASSWGWTSPRSRTPTRRRSAASSAGTASPPGATPARSARRNSLRDHPHRRGVHRGARRCRSRSARRSRATRRCRRPSGGRGPPPSRRRSAAIASPGQAAGRPLHRLRGRARLPGPREARRGSPRSAPRCPDHFLRTKVRPLVLDLPPTRPLEEVDRPAARAARGLPRRTTPPTTSGTRRPTRPPMRGADPAIVLVPGVGMFSFGKDKQTARVAGEFYVNAINVMRGAEAVSTYAPIDESEKFRIEYWALEEAKLQRMPKPKPLATRVALVTGAASGIGKAIAHAAGRRGRVRRRRRPSTARRRRPSAAELGGARRGGRRDGRRDATRSSVQAALDGRRARLRRGRPRGQQRRAVASPSRCWRPPRPTGTCSTT